MAKTIKLCSCLESTALASDVYSLTLAAEDIVKDAVPGQFVSVYTNSAEKLLPRPISICDVDKERGTLRLVYRVVGAGTEEFSRLKQGDCVRVLGPLGNGYPLADFMENGVGSAILFGGGIGIPPMLNLAKELSKRGISKENLHVVLGFRDESFLVKDFEDFATIHISSDLGTIGMKGNVVELAEKEGLKADVICACGPKPMLRAVNAYASSNDIKAYLSLEERMACGVGACLACVCESKDIDDHSKVHNKRVCADGPVFLSTEVVL